MLHSIYSAIKNQKKQIDLGNLSKQVILTEYLQLCEMLGYQPSAVQFYIETGISRADLRKFFKKNAFSELQKNCGDAPNTSTRRLRHSSISTPDFLKPRFKK